MSEVRSSKDLCGLRVSVKKYVAPNAHYNVSAASALDTYSVIADKRHGASRVEAPKFPLDNLPCGKSLSAVGVEETTRRTTGAELSGKKRRRLLQSRRPKVPERSLPKATLPLRKLSGPGPLPSRYTWASGGFTSSEGERVFKATTPPPFQNPYPQPVRETPKKL